MYPPFAASKGGRSMLDLLSFPSVQKRPSRGRSVMICLANESILAGEKVPSDMMTTDRRKGGKPCDDRSPGMS